jgi:putative glutamine amidotransferase
MLAHRVEVAAGSRLHTILGGEARVNSMHHQGVKTLGEGLRAVAHAPDGVVEGVEGENGQYLVGVQWHPEELLGAGAAMRALFDSFVAAARDFRSRNRLAERPTPADSTA